MSFFNVIRDSFEDEKIFINLWKISKNRYWELIRVRNRSSGRIKVSILQTMSILSIVSFRTYKTEVIVKNVNFKWKLRILTLRQTSPSVHTCLACGMWCPSSILVTSTDNFCTCGARDTCYTCCNAAVFSATTKQIVSAIYVVRPKKQKPVSTTKKRDVIEKFRKIKRPELGQIILPKSMPENYFFVFSDVTQNKVLILAIFVSFLLTYFADGRAYVFPLQQ